jgi:hypothetical protein
VSKFIITNIALWSQFVVLPWSDFNVHQAGLKFSMIQTNGRMAERWTERQIDGQRDAHIDG